MTRFWESVQLITLLFVYHSTFLLFSYFNFLNVIIFLNLELWVANAVEEAHLESWILFTRMQFIYKKRNTDSQAAQVGGTTNQKGTWTNKLKTV